MKPFKKLKKNSADDCGMNTEGYVAFDHLYDEDISELTRQQARENFNHFMATKDRQITRLKNLLVKNDLKLSGESSDISQINRWLIDSICEHKTDFFINDDGEKQHYIHPMWSNVLFDLSIFISEIVIQNTENVSWHFNINVPRNEISFQQPVLAGFSKIISKGYYQNFGLALFNFAREILDDPESATDEFLNFIIEDAILEDIDLEETMFDHTDFGEEIGLN